jgi:HK97 family phage prohead protease
LTNKEIRNAKFNLRAQGKKRYIEGYSPRWNKRSEDMGFREVFKPGAFTESLRTNPDVLCYYAHNREHILGRVSSGTMQVKEDSTGLWFHCELPDTQVARDLIVMMERGDLNAASFGFAPPEDGSGESWTREQDGTILRTITKATLFEVSAVGMPAYPDSKIALRHAPKNLREVLTTKRDSELERTHLLHLLRLRAE